MMGMTANSGGNPATHLGRQMQRDRLAHGWSLREMNARTGVHIGTLSQVENGKRPMTESLAAICDEQFPERRGWYSTYYEESKSWVPAAFRNWAEVEDKAVTIRSWTPSFIDGLLQTADYARAQLETATGVTAEVVSARLTNRMQRQQRVLYRPDPPAAWFVVDELSLYRCVGSPEIMAAQMRHVAEVARMAHVVIQVLPAVAHPAGASSFMLADNSAYAEHVASGFVYTDGPKVADMERLMATILSESEKASESLAMVERLGETWATGVSPLTAMRTADSV